MLQREWQRFKHRKALTQFSAKPYSTRWGRGVATIVHDQLDTLEVQWVAERIRELSPLNATKCITTIAQSDAFLELAHLVLNGDGTNALELTRSILRYSRCVPADRLLIRLELAEYSNDKTDLDLLDDLCEKKAAEHPLLCAQVFLASAYWRSDPLVALNKALAILEQHGTQQDPVLCAEIMVAIAKQQPLEVCLREALSQVESLSDGDEREDLFALFMAILDHGYLDNHVIVGLSRQTRIQDWAADISSLLDPEDTD